MIYAGTVLEILKGFTPRESLYRLLTAELRHAKAAAVADDLARMIRVMRGLGSITDGDADLLWRAQEWLAGGNQLTRTRSTH